MSVQTIDCQYLYPRFAASYLLTEGDEAIFVENNTTHSVPLLLDALRRAGMRPEQVRYLIVTHVHLDHAGGSQALMDACPNAVLLAHPRATPHLIDPSKLVTSARKVYGDEEFRKLYGEIGPIAADRVRSMEDGETLGFGARTLRFIHTRGHANHHFCIVDSGTKGVFTGDSFGLRYPDLQKGGLFVFPSTSPTDFDPALARQSIDQIVASGARRAYLTHYGELDDLPAAAAQLVRYLGHMEPYFFRMATSGEGDRPENELKRECETLIRSYIEDFFGERGVVLQSKDWEILKLDIELNAAGMVFAALKKRKTATALKGEPRS